MIVSSNEANVNDQAGIVDLFSEQMLQMTVEELFEKTTIEDNFMIINSNVIVFMAYYRDLYDESQFDLNKDRYKMREQLECLNMINLPSIEFVLLNTKFMQYIFQKTYKDK